MGRSTRRGQQQSRFTYKRPSYEEMDKRATQSGIKKDLYFAGEFDVFKIKEGDMCVRFLPPSWDDAEHYGYEIHVHRGIGADKSDYLCLNKMKGEACPLCEERDAFSDDAGYAEKLKPQKRYVVWLINRDDEKAGVLLWSMAWTIDRDIARISTDKRTKEVYFIDDIKDGWDLSFEMQMKKSKEYTGPTFVGFQLAKRSCTLFPDADEIKAAEDFISANPVPKCLKYYDYDYLANVFNPKKDEESEVGEEKAEERVAGKDDIPVDETEPAGEESTLTWEEIHKMSATDLDTLAVEGKLLNEEDLSAFEEGDEALADLLCEGLGIKKPSSGRAKLRTLRGKKK